MYIRGYDLNRDYLPKANVSKPRLVVNGLVGSLTDAFAPWYAIFAGRTGVHDFISKTPNGVGIRESKLKKAGAARRGFGS
jgi:hypothetical protein